MVIARTKSELKHIDYFMNIKRMHEFNGTFKKFPRAYGNKKLWEFGVK